MTGNRIRDSKRNPFSGKSKDGKYSTENQVSYYGKKLPDDTFSLIFPIRKYRRIWMNSER